MSWKIAPRVVGTLKGVASACSATASDMDAGHCWRGSRSPPPDVGQALTDGAAGGIGGGVAGNGEGTVALPKTMARQV